MCWICLYSLGHIAASPNNTSLAGSDTNRAAGETDIKICVCHSRVPQDEKRQHFLFYVSRLDSVIESTECCIFIDSHALKCKSHKLHMLKINII